MDLRKIKELIKLAADSDLAELEVRNGDECVRIVRTPGVPVGAQSKSTASGPLPNAASLVTARAPMAGTFYAAPQPDAAPFVQLGSRIRAGETLCIIESMKMMNEIPAEVDGTVVELLATSGEPVAKSQGLMRIEPEGS